ncbi:MAG: ATP-binding protein [Opitutales bacterium]|nr:ATP-binding protein [Opitutales bacterium]
MDEKLTYLPRTLERFFAQAASQFPVMLVTGPRQIGKTTFLRHLASDSRNYVTLDDPLLRELANEEPALFLQRFKAPVLIDEIQYAPGLLPHIKMEVDRDRKGGMYWLTGSQQFHLMRDVAESLAGRVGVVNLLGLSRRELIGKADSVPFLPGSDVLSARDDEPVMQLPGLFQWIWMGSFPALYGGPAVERDLFYSSYVQTYLQRDVRDLANVGDERAFLRFLRACAARTGQMLNMQDLSRDSDINPATAKRWLSILESSGIVYLLDPWHSNINKRMVKTPKLYFLDTGLAGYLTEWSSAATLEAGAMSGAFLETWVVSEILKSWWHNGKRAPLHYYRDKDTKEVDLLIHQDGIIYPVEVKKSANPGKDSIRNFNALRSLGQPIGEGAVISLVPMRLPIAEGVMAVPVGML